MAFQFQAERGQQVKPEIAAGALKAMYGLGAFVARSGLELSLIELVNTRASQINGSAFCIDMHTKDARARGESEQRLYLLPTWRESPVYSERERAALAWAEAVTLVAGGHVPDEGYEVARRSFTDDELVALTMSAITINSWNRLNIAFRTVAGTYEPAASPAAELVGAPA